TATDVVQVLHVVVANGTQIHALVHPQGVSRAKDQRSSSQQAHPEVKLHGTQNHHPLAHETSGSRQAAIGHGKQQRKRSKLGHGVDHTAVSGNFTRVHTVVQHANAQE